jgi:hypothetical protein
MRGGAALSRIGLSPLVLTLLIARVDPASACAVCLSYTDGTREAYYGTTALLMLLPFGLLGAILLWLRRAARRSARAGRLATADPPDRPES